MQNASPIVRQTLKIRVLGLFGNLRKISFICSPKMIVNTVLMKSPVHVPRQWKQEKRIVIFSQSNSENPLVSLITM